MTDFRRVKARHKNEDGEYELASYWTDSNSVEFNDGSTLEECKVQMNTAIQGKGDTLFYDDQTHMLYLLSGNNRISGVEIISAGMSGKIIGDVSNVTAVPTDTTVTLSWVDPTDTATATWAGTTLVRKKWSRPVDGMDGVVVLNETTRDQYRTNGYVDENLDKNTTYFYRFFPYTTENYIRSGTAVAVNTLKDEYIIEEYPQIEGVYVYTGIEQTVQLSNFDVDKMTVLNGTATDAGTYNVSITPKSGYKWPDNSSDAIILEWTIQKAKISVIPSQLGTTTYNGSERTPNWDNYDSNALTLSGTTSGTNAGDYTATFTPTANYTWSDGSVTGRDVVWTITRATILNVPSQSGTASYTGSSVTPTWNNYDSDKMTLSGQTSGVEIGNYVAVFSPTSNYRWSDSTTGEKEVTWSITAARISTVPTQSGTLTYTGNQQSPTWSNYDSTKLTIGGTTSGTNATTYTATFTPKSGYQWFDGTTSAKSATWVIGRQNITTIPSQSGSLTYNATEQSPTWTNYSSTKLTLAGTTAATTAGTYTATFTPTSNYQWEDGSTSAKNVSWVIGKASGTATLSKASVSLSGTASDTVTVSNATGNVSVSSNNSSVCTASLSGSTITITGVAAGSTTVTVNIASNTNYYSATKTISVTVEQVNLWITKMAIPNKIENYFGCATVYNNQIHAFTHVADIGKIHSTWSTEGVYWDNEILSSISNGSFIRVAVVYNSKLSIITNNGYLYELNNSTWTLKTQIPLVNNYQVWKGVVFNNAIHVFDTYGNHYKWNGSSWSTLNYLPTELDEDTILAVIENNIYYSTGQNNYHYVWTESTDTWTKASIIRNFGITGCSYVIGNEWHVFGLTSDKLNHYVYNTLTSSWSFVENLPINMPKMHNIAVVYDSKPHILGGSDSSLDQGSTSHYMRTQ